MSGWVARQLITGNRRVALVLALVTAFIAVAAVHVSQSWFSPGLLILPVLAGGLLLWPRALRVLFLFIAIGLAFATQEVDEVPITPRDARLDFVLTEREVIDFRALRL